MEQISVNSKLFQPFQIKGVELRNRAVMVPMGNGLSRKVLTQRSIDYYAARAKGGVGLILTEAMHVHPYGLSAYALPHMYEDGFVESLKALADTVHAQGGKIGVQLLFAGVPWTTGMNLTLAPNAIGNRAREVSIAEIKIIANAYGEAARTARAGGCDLVEIHCCHGSLPCLFLSPYYNRRTDEYGGETGRTKFPIDILNSIKERAGADFPVLFRINGHDFVGDKGVTLDVAKANSKRLEEAGADGIDVSSGIEFRDGFRGRVNCFFPIGTSAAVRWELAAGIKEVLNIPVIGSGGLTDPRMAEEMLQTGKADLAGFGRALLTDPDLLKKAKEGRFDDIRPCIRCMQGCLGRLFAEKNLDLTCISNPQVGHEREFVIKPADKKKKVLIVGAGPAGMEASLVAAQRGHEVILYEKSRELGGQFRLAAIPPGKSEIGNLIAYYERQMRKLGVKVELGKEATVEVVESFKPDVIIVAAGAVSSIPPIPGVKGRNVVTAIDVLEGRVEVGNKVIVVGGERVAFEVASFLSEQGKEVTIVFRHDIPCRGMEPMTKAVLLARVSEKGVEIAHGTAVKEIIPEGLITLSGPFGVPPEGKIEGETIVLATGPARRKEVIEQLKDKAAEFYAIGDCVQPRTALEAIHEGFHTARVI